LLNAKNLSSVSQYLIVEKVWQAKLGTSGFSIGFKDSLAMENTEKLCQTKYGADSW